MTSNIVGHPIVVGVDGSASALQAAGWAANEAALRRLPLCLVHGVHVCALANISRLGTSARFLEILESEGHRRYLIEASELNESRADPPRTLPTPRRSPHPDRLMDTAPPRFVGGFDPKATVLTIVNDERAHPRHGWPHGARRPGWGRSLPAARPVGSALAPEAGAVRFMVSVKPR